MRFTAVLLVFTSSLCAAERFSFSPDGFWVGGFSREGSIERAEFMFSTETGRIQGTYTIAELGLYDEPLTEMKLDGMSLKFKCLHGEFLCTVDTVYQEITGINEKWQPPVRFHIKRAERQWPVTRKEEISFESGDVTLAGTMYKPEQPGSYQAIVIMHGGSIHTRQEWTYRSRGEEFARHGVIALVYDKRGYGASSGASPSLREQAADANAAIAFMRAQSEVDKQRVGVMASSQSGWPAAMLASQGVGDFFILNSSPATSPETQEIDRVEFSLRQEGVSEDSIQLALTYTRRFFETVHEQLDFSKLKSESDKYRGAAWAEMVSLVLDSTDLEWYRNNDYDPAQDLAKIKTPVLVLYGENDPVVPPARNVALMESFLNNNPHARIVVFPRGSHLIEDWGTLTTGEWAWPSGYWKWSRRAAGYFETIHKWLAGLK